MKRSGIQRKAPLRSSGPPERRTRVKPRNAARAAESFERAYHSDERIKFINAMPCSQCGVYPRPGAWHRVIVNAHTKTGGTSRKADYPTIVPLCSTINRDGCHDIQHQHGWARLSNLSTTEKREAMARKVQRLWSAHLHQQTGAGTSGSASVAPSEGTANAE